MPINLCVFEDNHFNTLYPLTLTRPVFELRCGCRSLLDKIRDAYPDATLHLYCRKSLAALVAEMYPTTKVNAFPAADALFVNGAFLFESSPPEASGPEQVWVKEDRIVAARLTAGRISRIAALDDRVSLTDIIAGVVQQEISGTFITYPWDLINNNPKEIQSDCNRLQNGGEVLGYCHPNTTLLNAAAIHIAANAVVKPGVVLDAEDGPIFIDDGATIMANAFIQGPAYIGPRSVIKAGAKIYEGTSIGTVCKVGGEVEESIIHGYSNKQHEGFLGHAYLGEWVNLGADSNNSDLKNNYGTVKVHIDGQMIDSGSLFVGLFMGDHSKCGINTMFNTGTVVGVMSNVFGAGYTPKFIPSFAWGGIGVSEEHSLDKALDTARRVMGRRKRDLTAGQAHMLRQVFKDTDTERKQFLQASKHNAK